MRTNFPAFSIVIVTWNSGAHISHCLTSLRHQTIQDFEIIIVDNGSTDKTIDEVNSHALHLPITVERMERNIGFAAANNLGARLARGKWLALLNADAFPEPDWLEKLLRAAEEHPEYSFFASRQIQANKPEWLDGAGDAYNVSGLAWRRYYNFPASAFGHQTDEIFSACGAAALYRKEDFLKAGGFDEAYFSYFEDVDLGFRLRLAGNKCLYVPQAVVYHVGSASTGKRSDFSVYYGYRNMIWTFFKDMPSPLIWFFLPLHIATLFFFVFYLSLRGQRKAIGQAIYDALKGLPGVLEKRKSIQKAKKIKSLALLKVMSTGVFEPYREFIQRNKMR
jgi:GT2 family glycosyltransferase